MRVIKFRVWDNKNKRFVKEDADLIINEGNHCLQVYCCGEICETYTDIQLQQYTGLKDKNGKEIYEGDIVRYNYFNDEEYLICSPIIFENGEFYPEDGYEYVQSWAWQCEVIGNIYENPKLLKSKEV